MSVDQCPGCGSPIKLNYCPHCGEKRYKPKDLAFVHLIKQLFTSLTDIDNKLIKSFYLLLVKPGQLSLDYIRGVRKQRLNPIQLFLICNLIYFFFVSFTHQNTFRTQLHIHLNAYNFIHNELAIQLVDEKLKHTKEDRARFEKRFDAKIDVYSKSLVFLIIPIIALSFFLVYVFPKKQFLTVKSIVFATNLSSFLLCLLILQFMVAISLLKGFQFVFDRSLSSIMSNELFSSLTLFAFIWWYLFQSAKRLFTSSKVMLLLKSFIMLIAVYLALLIYRMILFFVTFYSV